MMVLLRAHIHAANEPSARLLQRLGFREPRWRLMLSQPVLTLIGASSSRGFLENAISLPSCLTSSWKKGLHMLREDCER